MFFFSNANLVDLMARPQAIDQPTDPLLPENYTPPVVPRI
jgi:hypothetical protein